jgi:hypothetical protein
VNDAPRVELRQRRRESYGDAQRIQQCARLAEQSRQRVTSRIFEHQIWATRNAIVTSWAERPSGIEIVAQRESPFDSFQNPGIDIGANGRLEEYGRLIYFASPPTQRKILVLPKGLHQRVAHDGGHPEGRHRLHHHFGLGRLVAPPAKQIHSEHRHSEIRLQIPQSGGGRAIGNRDYTVAPALF